MSTVDLATLGLEIDSTQVKSASSDLDKFASSAQKAGSAASGSASGIKEGTDATRTFSDEAKKLGSEHLPGVSSALGKLSSPLVAFGAALAASVSGMVALGIQAIESADRINDLAIGTGRAHAELQTLQVIAEKNGTSLDTLLNTLDRVSRNMNKVDEESSKAARAFAYFGVATTDSAGKAKTSQQVLLELAKAYEESEKTAATAAAMTDATGRSYREVQAAALGLAEAEKELQSLKKAGADLDQNLATAADAYNDSLRDIKSVMSGIGFEIARSLLPLLQSMSTLFASSATDGGTLQGVIGTLTFAIDGLVQVLKVVPLTLITIDSLFKIVGESLGAFAAATVFVLTGQFAKVKTVYADLKQDIQKITADANKNIEALYTTLEKGGEVKKGTKNNGDYSPVKKADVAVIADYFAEIQKLDAAMRKLTGADGGYTHLFEATARIQADLKAGKVLNEEQTRNYIKTALAADQLAISVKAAAAEQKAFQDQQNDLFATEDAIDKLVKGEQARTVELRIGKQAVIDLHIAELERYLDDDTRSDEAIESIQRQIDKWNEYKGAIRDGEAVREQIKQTEDAGKKQLELWDSLSTSAGNFFSDLVFNGKSAFDSLKQTLKSFAAEILAFFAKKYFLQMVAGASGTFGGTAASAASSALGGMGSSAMGSMGNSLLSTGLSAAGTYLFGTAGTVLGASGATIGAGVGSGMMLGGAAGQGAVLAGTSGAIGAGGVTASITTALAAIPVWGWIAIAALAAYAAFGGKGGGPKTSGTAIFDASSDGTVSAGPMSDVRRFYNTDNKSLDSVVAPLVEATAKSYADLVKRFGGSGQATFTQSTDTDPQGTASNRVATQAFINGIKVFEQKNENLGRDNAAVGPELQLQAERALVAALQASNLQGEMAALFSGVVADTLSQSEYDALIAKASDLQMVIDAIGATKVPNLTIESLRKMQLAGESLGQTFVRVSNEFLTAQANLNAAIGARNPTFARETTLNARNEIAQAFADALGLNFGEELLARMALNPETFSGLTTATMNLLTQFLGLQTTLEGLDGQLATFDSRVTTAGQNLQNITPVVQTDHDRAVDEWVRRYQEAAEAARLLAERLATARNALEPYLRGSLTSELSPLTATQQYNESRETYQRLLALAQGGNVEAIGELGSARDDFLRRSRVINASGSQYNNDFFSTFDQINAIIGNRVSRPVAPDDISAQTTQIVASNDRIVENQNETTAAVAALASVVIEIAQTGDPVLRAKAQEQIEVLNRIANRGGAVVSNGF